LGKTELLKYKCSHTQVFSFSQFPNLEKTALPCLASRPAIKGLLLSASNMSLYNIRQATRGDEPMKL